MSKKSESKTTKVNKTHYYDIKRRVLGWEKNNYSQLAVLEDSNGMHKMFDHSAVIYVHQVAKRLKIAANIKVDSDFELTSDKPVCLIHDMDVLRRKLGTIGIRMSSKEDGVEVFDLGYTVDPVEYSAMLTEEEELKRRINSLVLPIEVYPALRFEMEQLTKCIYDAVRKMESVSRETIGNELLLKLANAMEGFIEAANGHEDMDDYLQELVKLTRHANARLKVISDIRIMDDDVIYGILIRIKKVQKKTAGAIENRQTKKDKKGK